MHVQGSVSWEDNELSPFIMNWHDIIQLRKTNSVPPPDKPLVEHCHFMRFSPEDQGSEKSS